MNLETHFQSIVDAAEREARAKRRAGTSGPWCFGCGGNESDDLAPCACDFPVEFRCVNLRTLCAECRAGHKNLSRFLTGMFAEKKVTVPRVDSRRARKFRYLRDALEKISESQGNAAANSLRRLLCMACPFGDEPDEFKRNVLAAFSRASFSDFKTLARQIEEEERVDLVARVAMNIRHLASQIQK